MKWRAAKVMARFVCKDPDKPRDGHPLVAGQSAVQPHSPLFVGHKGLCVTGL